MCSVVFYFFSQVYKNTANLRVLCERFFFAQSREIASFFSLRKKNHVPAATKERPHRYATLAVPSLLARGRAFMMI